MKKIFLSLLLSFTLVLNANMASPYQTGTLGTNPFLNDYVRVLHENILITLADDLDYAKFDVTYQIESEKDGIKIPFLFYAMQFNNDFEVSIDGKKIELKKFEHFWDSANIKKNNLTNFDYLYTINREEISKIDIAFKSGKSELLRFKDFIYFETDIPKGKHTINVSYKASHWQYNHSRLKEICYNYALSPTKYWKSFGTLDIKIDASNFSNEISTNLGKPKNGSLDNVFNFHFTEIPVAIINITLEPKLSGFAKLLLKISYFGIALLFMIPLIYFHYKLMKKYRKRNPTVKVSAIAIIGSVILPLLYIFMLIFSSFFIDYFLGIYASGREGYGAFFSFYFLPKFWLYYLIFTFILDFIIKKTIQKQVEKE